MSAKGILIAFVIVSLLLIGMMFLVVDVRNNPVQDNQSITNTTERQKKRAQALKDSLKSKVSSTTNNVALSVEAINAAAKDILEIITELEESLFPGGLAAHDLKTSDRVAENNTVFFKENGEYSEQSIRFVGRLDAFENVIRNLQKTHPTLANITPEVRNPHTGNTDWLNYNFKDFPAVASYSRLKSLAEAIRTKKEEATAALLKNK
ncbi:MAG: hypothetical protein AAF611_09190 [Bacteroidota bacterium]